MSQDFIKAKIYKITNDYNDDVYVGSTCDTLVKRFNTHKRHSIFEKRKKGPLHTLMNEIGFDRFRIELVEDFPCNDKYQLRQRESKYIREIGTLNKRIEDRDLKEYYQDNKEKIIEKSRKYYNENRDTILIKDKEYREKNKEEINKSQKNHYLKNKEQINLKQHEFYEQNKEKIKAKSKDYRNNNLEKVKQYYLNNKEKILAKNASKNNEKVKCECGFLGCKGNMNRHKKSVKHIQNLELINNQNIIKVSS